MKNKIVQFISFALIVCLASCSTSRKHKSITKIEEQILDLIVEDSSSSLKRDSTTVKKDNTIITLEKEDNYTKETVIEFNEQAGKVVDSIYKARGYDVNIDPADYFPAIKKVTIKETGIKKSKETTVRNTYDSTNVKSEYIVLRKTTRQLTIIRKIFLKNKEKETKSYWGWLWIGLIGAAVWFVGWWFGLWRWVAKKIKGRKDLYPVKYKKT